MKVLEEDFLLDGGGFSMREKSGDCSEISFFWLRRVLLLIMLEVMLILWCVRVCFGAGGWG